jgi:hypothetical protein
MIVDCPECGRQTPAASDYCIHCRTPLYEDFPGAPLSPGARPFPGPSPSASPRIPRSNAARSQKWKYLVVRWELGEDWGKWYVRSTNGEDISDWKKQKLSYQAILNRFGDDGWELVESENLSCTFKRPKL